MACDHIDFEIYTVIQVTHNHYESIVFLKEKVLQEWHMII